LTDDVSIHLVLPRAPKDLGDLDDDDLMLLAKAERQDAFAALMRRHQALVFGVATRFLGDRGLGRDVMQDVFLSLWRERDRYGAKGRFRSYLVSMTLHRCHMVARNRQSQDRRISALARAQENAPQSESLPLDVVVERERSKELRRLLAGVPEHHRQVLILRFAEDLGLEEIAAATSLPLGTVKSHLFRGLRTLRDMMRKESPS
jgi:RNA polymerase sigma-70 factor (ECF subfamily)